MQKVESSGGSLAGLLHFQGKQQCKRIIRVLILIPLSYLGKMLYRPKCVLICKRMIKIKAYGHVTKLIEHWVQRFKIVL